jgi:hypothetical protein
MQEFSFVLSHDQGKFDKQVEAKLNDGWNPVGGMGVLKEPTQYTYWLAFVRAKKEE